MKKIPIIVLVLLAGLAHPAHADPAIAVYIVPPANADQVAASYPMTVAEVVPGPQGERVLQMRLPEDLAGKNPETLVLKATPGTSTPTFTVFQGNDISASCTDSPTRMICVFNYTTQYRNGTAPTDVTTYLRAKYSAAPAVLALKLGQATLFFADPEGVLVLLH